MPANLLRSIFSGLTTSLVLSVVFFCLLGWMIFLQTANNDTDETMKTIAEAVWPTDEVVVIQSRGRLKIADHPELPETAEVAEVAETVHPTLEKANQLYGGLQGIPLNERAEMVTTRLTADRLASVVRAFLYIVIVAILFFVRDSICNCLVVTFSLPGGRNPVAVDGVNWRKPLR